MVLTDGTLTWYLERGGRSLLTFGADRETEAAAAASLGDLVRTGRLTGILIEKINGVPVLSKPDAALDSLVKAGFAPTPRGLRLRR